MKTAWKVWLVNGNAKVFGKGPRELLMKIESDGSINKAATEIGMSYSKALKLINTIEKELGIIVLERQTGGINGGGSVLTDDAKDLIVKFDRYEKEVGNAIEEIYNRIF
ncbi:MAG: LysR family transcriptional regulator [Bacillota bacterium]|nr:LysR family transcriptional regulator [Bacillota bacterium]